VRAWKDAPSHYANTSREQSLDGNNEARRKYNKAFDVNLRMKHVK